MLLGTAGTTLQGDFQVLHPIQGCEDTAKEAPLVEDVTVDGSTKKRVGGLALPNEESSRSLQVLKPSEIVTEIITSHI